MGTGFRENTFLKALLRWLVSLWIVSAIDPFDRRDWLLENLLVFIFGKLLVRIYRRFALSSLS